MIIRALKTGDLDQIKRIHEKYYKEEFELPDFIKGYLCAFVVVDNDEIISAGGVRNIAESIVITNKDCSVRDRAAALLQVLDASAFVAGRSGYDGLHAFVQNDKWKKHLEEIGFHNTKGQALVLEL